MSPTLLSTQPWVNIEWIFIFGWIILLRQKKNHLYNYAEPRHTSPRDLYKYTPGKIRPSSTSISQKDFSSSFVTRSRYPAMKFIPWRQKQRLMLHMTYVHYLHLPKGGVIIWTRVEFYNKTSSEESSDEHWPLNEETKGYLRKITDNWAPDYVYTTTLPFCFQSPFWNMSARRQQCFEKHLRGEETPYTL